MAVVVHGAANSLALYIHRVEESSNLFSGSLALWEDTTNWIGRSLNATEPFLEATLHEFRSCGFALSTNAVALSAAPGPDTEFLSPDQFLSSGTPVRNAERLNMPRS